MNRIPLPNRAIALPLIGLLCAWLFSMVSQYVGMIFEQNSASQHPSFYAFLAGLLLAGATSMVGRGIAVRVNNSEPSALTHAAVRFTTLAIVLSLAALTIFAFTMFLTGFNEYNRWGSVLDRLMWLYLPIILATAAVVFLILRAFVFGQSTSRIDGQEKTRMSEAQKALALGYAVPILCAAFAIILGLFIYDATRTNLQTWVWVVIIAIVGFGVIAGTRFASKARAGRPEVAKPRAAIAAAGAAMLNFVLSVVFGAIVSILAFTLGSEAMNKLQYTAMPIYSVDVTGPTPEQINSQITPTWYFNDMLPAKILILLAVVGIYLSITERNRNRNSVESESN